MVTHECLKSSCCVCILKASLAQSAEPLLCFGFPLKTHALKMEPLYATFCFVAVNHQAILALVNETAAGLQQVKQACNSTQYVSLGGLLAVNKWLFHLRGKDIPLGFPHHSLGLGPGQVVFVYRQGRKSVFFGNVFDDHWFLEDHFLNLAFQALNSFNCLTGV